MSVASRGNSNNLQQPAAAAVQHQAEDEFDEVEDTLVSYKRFMKRLRFTIFNPLLVGASFAFGLSIGERLSSGVLTLHHSLSLTGPAAGFALFDWSARLLKAHPPLPWLFSQVRLLTGG
jgi:hypothetical protein